MPTAAVSGTYTNMQDAVAASIAALPGTRDIDAVSEAFSPAVAAAPLLAAAAETHMAAALPPPQAPGLSRKGSGRVVVAVATDVGEPPAEHAANLAVLERFGCAHRGFPCRRTLDPPKKTAAAIITVPECVQV